MARKLYLVRIATETMVVAASEEEAVGVAITHIEDVVYDHHADARVARRLANDWEETDIPFESEDGKAAGEWLGSNAEVGNGESFADDDEEDAEEPNDD